MLLNKFAYQIAYHDWKVIPLNFFNKDLAKKFSLYSNLSILNKTIKSLSPYYKNIIIHGIPITFIF